MQQKLAQEGSNNSGALRQSLAANFNDSVDEKGGIISGLIIAKDYWAFVDEGVRGVGGECTTLACTLRECARRT